jgi:predicted Zn-dependent protease
VLPARDDSLELRGPDPRDVTSDVQDYARGWGAYSDKRFSEAARIFADLSARHPESLAFLTGLIDSRTALGENEELARLLRRALELSPGARGLRTRLAGLLSESGEWEPALEVLREGLADDPCDAALGLYLSEMLAGAGHHREKLDFLEQTVERCPDSQPLRNALAYGLTTSPDPSLRGAQRALALAGELVQQTRGEHPDYLDTLACAHAAAGDFESAVDAARRALASARAGGYGAELTGVFRDQLDQFTAQRGCETRLPAPAAAD